MPKTLFERMSEAQREPMTDPVQPETQGERLGVPAAQAGLSPSVEPLRVSPPVSASIPNAGREWTRWSDQRPPNERGEFRYRATFDLLGVTVSPEWTEGMSLCGMGYGDSEWWPLQPCYWDGYRRYITIANLEWSPVLADDPKGVVWHGLDLSPCPFTGAAPLIEVSGQYIGAPLWRSEAVWLSSPFVPKRRWTNAKAMQAAWNTRVPAKAIEAGTAETQGSVHESAVAESHSPNPAHNPGTPNHE